MFSTFTWYIIHKFNKDIILSIRANTEIVHIICIPSGVFLALKFLLNLVLQKLPNPTNFNRSLFPKATSTIHDLWSVAEYIRYITYIPHAGIFARRKLDI